MSVRKKTGSRLNLIRTCQTCGRVFPTTADSPWMRQLANVDGKKQKTCYFCSSSCFQASYKHIGWYDGKAKERRRQRESQRDRRGYNKSYYAAHAERERRRARESYWADPEAARADTKYQRKKRKLKTAG